MFKQIAKSFDYIEAGLGKTSWTLLQLPTFLWRNWDYSHQRRHYLVRLLIFANYITYMIPLDLIKYVDR